MFAKVGPLLLEQHDDSNLPHCKVLLVAIPDYLSPAATYSLPATRGGLSLIFFKSNLSLF
jgi:hypothetical protein